MINQNTWKQSWTDIHVQVKSQIKTLYFGEVSIDVSGGKGFNWSARFSETELDISVSSLTDGLTDLLPYKEGNSRTNKVKRGTIHGLVLIVQTRNESGNLKGQN